VSSHVDLSRAVEILADRVRALGDEEVALPLALDRVLAEEVVAARDVPPFAKAAVDGWAVRAEDTFGAGPLDPCELAIAGEALPDKPAERALERGEAIRIMTGSPVPDGADAVVMLENVEERGKVVRLTSSIAPRKNVAPRGEDVRAGDVVAARGRRLRPEDIGLLASIRKKTVRVHRRPSVLIWSSGDELVDPLSDDPGGPRAIFDANGYVLEAQARRAGALVRRGGILRDDKPAVRAALAHASEDVTITSGAASKGEHDFMAELVRELGELWVHGVSIRPAHPTGFGRIGERLHFMLPGNPVAAWIGFRVFVRPALRLLEGESKERAFARERVVRARLARKIGSVIGRTDFCRVNLASDGTVVPLTSGGAGALTTVTRADGIVVVPKELEGLEEGTEVDVELLD
jgi:molybdopterin molybdotransferase